MALWPYDFKIHTVISLSLEGNTEIFCFSMSSVISVITWEL